MRFADYCRKSVFSDKSDSIDNQHRMSVDYASVHFPGQVDSFVHYYDEDYTGANTKRPGLQQLLSDIEADQIDVLIVYQIDRLSRDIKDFANLYSFLSDHRVEFVSVKENVDTTTPIGRAMMFVAVVFAQMERETISVRVSDNMIGLAKKGFWTGGNPPYGFSREEVIVDGKKHVTISPDPDGVSYTMNVFDTFLDGGFSLQSLETYFRKNGIRTVRGAFFSTTQLHKILTMPYCVEATPEVYDFYSAKGCIMSDDRSAWNGEYGVMVYGRTTERNKKHELQPPEKWIVCVGRHKPFMPASKWLAAQNQLSHNTFIKAAKYDIPLLKGVLRCSCGTLMAVSRKKKVDGSVSSWYYCVKRVRQGKEVCPISQIKCDLLDNAVLDIFRKIEHDPSLIRKYAASTSSSDNSSSSSVISQRIKAQEERIRRLAGNLAQNSDSSAAKYIIEEMERLDGELKELKQSLLAASAAERQAKIAGKTLDDKCLELHKLLDDFDNFTAKERNEVARRVLESCVWDGETLSVTF